MPWWFTVPVTPSQYLVVVVPPPQALLAMLLSAPAAKPCKKLPPYTLDITTLNAASIRFKSSNLSSYKLKQAPNVNTNWLFKPR